MILRSVKPHAPALALALLSFALNAWGVRWGLPNLYTWAPDEIIPAQVLEGEQQRFSGGWWNPYPPFHFYVMAAAYAPVRWLSTEPVAIASASKTYARCFVAGRLVTSLMGAAIVLILYVCGLVLLDSTAGLGAGLLVLLSPTFVYYSKTANFDVPYAFWFAVALVFYLRALRDQRLSDWLGFSAASMLSIWCISPGTPFS